MESVVECEELGRECHWHPASVEVPSEFPLLHWQDASGTP
ncbi:hypothetical protein PLANPX_5456 [Lacipirellula parvula]|uniref:Uncharacterized protein n=1 Tax=Lacipirellula parvula TaxID=2650471 RepID=A0A5K7XG52_9BACT|nr:hypothetical protein PLANPX_5456 [Lacipirellula parvula]